MKTLSVLRKSLLIAVILASLVSCTRYARQVPIPEPVIIPAVTGDMSCLDDETYRELEIREAIIVANYTRLKLIVEAFNNRKEKKPVTHY